MDANTIDRLMTKHPKTLPASATAMDAARIMREEDIGDVLVMKDDQICGIVTDRDLVLRVLAEGSDPGTVTLGSVCSSDLTSVAATETVDRVIDLMRDRALRRVPVVADGKPVGIVSLGDLAIERDRRSVLADISAAPPSS